MGSQTPAPSQLSALSHSVSDGSPHAEPAASYVQVGAQQSPGSVLPSSHCSPGSTVPSPHAAAGSQTSSVSLQVSPGGQGSPTDEQSLVGSQNSVPLQNRPSSGQLASLGTLTHVSPASLHESSVQPTPSSHGFGAPPPQVPPPSQTSSTLQNRPSSQVVPAGSLFGSQLPA